MFKSSHVPCFLNGFAGHGDDTESKELKLVFHVVAISQQLAAEVSPQIADRLFRKNEEGEWMPAEEITKATFAGISIQMQNITFYELPYEAGGPAGVLVEGCAISNLRAQRPFVEARLEFDVVVPMDRSTMRLIEKYYKATCFLTMEQIQREMEIPPVAEPQAEIQDTLQSAMDEPTEDAAPKKRGRKARETVEA